MKKNLFGENHTFVERNYLERMDQDKPACMEKASAFGNHYWDDDRKFGYGGYHYDGRWKDIGVKLIEVFQLSEKSKILDIGCGKGFLLYEIKKILPGITVEGLDISDYAINNTLDEIDFLKHGDLNNHALLETYEDQEFDLVLSLMTLHNLGIESLERSLEQITRISKKSYITVESYRSFSELFNLQCWALTCRSFYSTTDWEYLFRKNDYRGDYEFLFFT
jgi:SAM-dependent methyltransferase